VQPGPHDRDLGHGRVGRQLPGGQFADERIERLLGGRQFDAWDRERQVGLAAVANVLDDHVDVDPGLGERVEDRAGDAGPVGDRDDRDLGDVPVVGEPADLVALLHERILLDERARGVLERAEDLDDDAVDPTELDRPDLHDLGPLVGELEHLLVADDGELAGARHEARVGGVDALDVGEDLAAPGTEAGGQRDRGRVAPAPAKGRDLVVVDGRGALALEPGHDHDLAGREFRVDAAWLDARDASPSVAAIGGDPGLRAGQADGRDAEPVERHRQQRRTLVLAGREQDVELARVGLVRDRRGKAEQLIGRVAHRGDDHDQVVAGRTLACDAPGDALDPVGVGDRRPTEFLDDERG
jgi:hypothetical protein